MKTLMEKYMLLTFDEKKGKTSDYAAYTFTYAIAGIILYELAKIGKIQVEKKSLKVMDCTTTGDDLLDEALNILANNKRVKDPNGFVQSAIWKIKKPKERLYERLVNKGWLRPEERRILGLIPVKYYLLTNPTEHNKLIARFRDILLNYKGDVTDEESLLISMAHACRFVRIHFTKEERKLAEKRAAEIAKDQLISKSVNDAVASAASQAANAAIISAICISTSSNSSN